MSKLSHSIILRGCQFQRMEQQQHAVADGRQLSNWANQAKDHFPTTICSSMSMSESSGRGARVFYQASHQATGGLVWARTRALVLMRSRAVLGGHNHRCSRANKRRLSLTASVWLAGYRLEVLFLWIVYSGETLKHRRAALDKKNQYTGKGALGSNNSKLRWSCLEIFHFIIIFIEL